VFINKSPIIYNSKWLFLLFILLAIPTSYLTFTLLLVFRPLIFIIPISFFIFFLLLYKKLNGYIVYASDYEDFYNKLFSTLDSLNLNYEKSTSKICIKEPYMHINFKIRSTFGSGYIILKGKDKIVFFNKIINSLKNYRIKPNMKLPIINIIFGFIFLIGGFLYIFK
jgi:hypothetical protein